MAINKVFLIKPSYDDDKAPYVTFKVAPNAKRISMEWLTRMLDGELPFDDYEPLTLIPSDGMSGLDFHGGGTIGLLSERAFHVLAPYMKQCFEFYQVFVNDQP